MRLMILENQRLRSSLRSDGDVVTIGSDQHCHIHLPDPRLGKHQANIAQDDEGEWWLEVLDLAVPTCVNRAVQKSRTRLRHADEIECGPFSIRFFIESEKSREEVQHERAVALLKSHADSLPLGTIILKDEAEMPVTREQLEQNSALVLRLSQCESVGDTLPIILFAAIRQFSARRAWIGLRKAEKDSFDWVLGQNAAGRPIVRPSFSDVTEHRCMKAAHHLCTPQVPHDGVGSAMAVPVIGSRMVLGMLHVENDPGESEFTEQSLMACKALACCASAPIEAIIQQSIATRRAAAVTELTIARTTQDAISPKALPQWENLQVAAYRHMGSEHCCDYYDVMQLRDRTAAVVVARLQFPPHSLSKSFGEVRAAFRSAVLYGEAPHLFLRALNWLVFDADAETHVDIAVARIWPETGVIQLCTGGSRILPAKIGADGIVSPIDLPSTPPVGQAKGTVYEAQNFELREGESFALVTAGVDSVVTASGERFKREDLWNMLGDGVGETPSHALSEFATDLTDFLAGGSCPEDITIVMVQRQSSL